jgi:hypothetical protein
MRRASGGVGIATIGVNQSERIASKKWLKHMSAHPQEPASSTSANDFPAPWAGERVSLFRHLASFPLDDRGRLPEAASTLPDEAVVQRLSGSDVRWAPGAMDGVLSHHLGAKEVPAEQAIHLLEAALDTRAPEAVMRFYELVNGENVLQLVDPLTQAIRASATLQPDSLLAFARWLACESPDRSAVKMGIALLGLFRPPQDTRTLLRLGLHEEFTLYATVALANTLPPEEVEDTLWSLARCVDGWGRIHLVERLARSSRPDLKAWLLREGYKNSVMNEYLACTCAVSGGLLQALAAGTADAALLEGAGDLIQALLAGGPAEDIHAYDDGAAVVAHYLRHVAQWQDAPPSAYLAVSGITDFLSNADTDWMSLEAMGWSSSHRLELTAAAGAILDAPRCKAAILAGLEARDTFTFSTAASVAECKGMDIWEWRFARQRDGHDVQWFHLMRAATPERVDRLIDLVLAQIDLASLATGPAQDLGLGPHHPQHWVLGCVLQGLDKFPGKGWRLVEAGLQSPVINNRQLALNALAAWPRAQWPDAAQACLSQALAIEPEEEVRARMVELLEG